MVFLVPFTASVSLRSITIKAGPSGHTPREVHIVSQQQVRQLHPAHIGQYRDAPGMDFGDTDRTATQVLEMVESREGVEYQVK